MGKRSVILLVVNGITKKGFVNTRRISNELLVISNQ